MKRLIASLLCLAVLLFALPAMAQESADALTAMNSMLALIPASTAASQDAPKGTGVDYAIWGTPVTITLPEGSYRDSQSDTLDIWNCPATGHVVGFGINKYYDLSTWSAAMEQNGCSVGSGTIGGVKLVYGIGYDDSGFNVTFYYNYGGVSYCIMGAGMTEDQSTSLLDDIVATIRIESTAEPTPTPYVTPTPTPTPAPVSGVDVVLFDTNLVITLPEGSSKYSTYEDTSIWKVPYTWELFSIGRQDVCGDINLHMQTLEEMGYTANAQTVGGIDTAWGLKFDGSRYDYMQSFSYAGLSYILQAVDLTEDQVYEVAAICDTLRIDPSIEVPGTAGVVVSNGVVTGYTGTATTVVIPSGVTAIGEGAFSSKSDITRIILPEGIKSIGKNAFSGCWKLESINLPQSITSIDPYAFYCCFELTSLILPDGITTLSDYAFNGCSALTSVKLPSSLEHIGIAAFSSCSVLTNISLPDTLKTIDRNAFSSCKALPSITLPDGLESIGSSAFSLCEAMTTATVPYSVTNIGTSAFPKTTTIKCWQGSYADTWAQSKSYPISYIGIMPTPTPTPTPAPTPMPTPTPEEFVIENGVLTAYNGTAVDVVVPDEVTAIGEKAFYRCSKIVSVSLPYGVTSIGDYAFYGCYDLADIDIPESVTSIGSRAFSYCYDLTEVYLPDSVEELGTYVFSGCNQLASVRLPLYIAEFPNGTFSNCDALTKITIPGAVTSFADFNAFEETTTVRCYQGSYADVWAREEGFTVEYIDNACTTSFTLPASLTAIEDEAFIGLAAEQIIIPDGVTSIGEYAFMDCRELMQLHIPQSVTEIADTAFDGAVELAIYTSPDAPAYQIVKEYSIPVVFLAE